MEALFFIRGGGLAWQPPGAARRPRWAQDRRRQLRHPHLPEAWEARQRGGHHSSRLLAQWRRSGWCRRRRRSLVELISFADAPPAGLVRTKPRCTLQAHDVAIEVAQHFGKIVVKSVFCEVWFCSDCRRYIMNEVAVEDHYFGSLKTDNLAARLSTRHHERPKGAIGPKLSRAYHVVFKNVGTKFNFCVGSPAEFSARFRRKNLDGLHGSRQVVAQVGQH